ncbi:MAG: phosphatase PAP2 family protein, partial [Ruegeria sp.]
TINLFTDMMYGALLRDLAANGVPVITPSIIIGTIAFPSFHTVMAVLVVWYLRGTSLFLPALLINVMMAPAILVHGGHYLTDMVGGVATFAVSAWLAGFLNRKRRLYP